MDFQILWEADLIENMQVMEVIKDAVLLKQFISDNFKTDSGKDLAFGSMPGNKKQRTAIQCRPLFHLQ
jgi:hypothetical protein